MNNLKSNFLAMLLLAAGFCFLSSAVSAKDEWLKVRSKNFNLVGNSSEKEIRKVATKLEQFRESFRQLFAGTNLNAAIPTNVVVFKSGGSYKPFKPKRADGKIDNFVAGYFQPGEDVNYITLSTEGEDAETYGTIFHEYVHFIINTNFGKSEVPPWFNEGLAEYYQTFAIEADQKVKLGLPQSGHLQLLQDNKLIPLDTLFKISNYALHQNANHSRSIFYAQAWALIHYLVQGGKSEGLGKFLNLAMKDVPAEKAFQDSFQMNYASMEKELKKYVAQNSYKYSIVTFKDKLVFDAEMQVAPLSEAETNAYLGDLLYHTNRHDDAEAYLKTAVALDPQSSMANTSLGMVKLRQRKYDESKNYLEKAISGDQKNHLAYFQYAYLLSREDRDEFGFVQSFPADKSAKMRELLKKAIAVNPSYTESYELLAFVGLVNNEQLDEAVAYLRKALRYQPGNQSYAARIAEIYLRQNKFAEAEAIADKIAKTAGEPELKASAEKLIAESKQRQAINASNEAARKQYETAMAEATKNGAQPIIRRRGAGEKAVSPEELAKREEESQMRSINQSLAKVGTGEKQIVGQIQKIDCKNGTITYQIKAGAENLTLSSKDFEGLTLTSHVAETLDAQIGCAADVSRVTSVLTYKPQANVKGGARGVLVAVDFVPKNFRFVDLTAAADNRIQTVAENQTETEEVFVEESTPPPAAINSGDLNERRRAMILESIKAQMRQPQAGEKRELGFIEKVECSNKGMFFHFKVQAQMLKLSAASPQAIHLRGFTPEIQQLQLGCTLKQVEIPVVFIYKENLNPKNKSNGELLSMEFMPKNFVLEK